MSSTTQPTKRRARSADDLRNRPTKRLLKDRAYLAGKQQFEGLTDGERDELRGWLGSS